MRSKRLAVVTAIAVLAPAGLLAAPSAAAADRTPVVGNGPSYQALTTGRGRDVVFSSEATNLVPDDRNGATDVFLRNVKAGRTLLVSASVHGGTGNGLSYDPSVSDDGRYVAFSSSATDLVPGDVRPPDDPLVGNFVRDTVLGTTRRIPFPTPSGTPLETAASHPRISGDGRYVAFTADSAEFTSTPFYPEQVYRVDLQTGERRLVSATSSGAPGDDGSRVSDISADGRYVVFETVAAAFGARSLSDWQIVRKDMVTGAVVTVGSSPFELSPYSAGPTGAVVDAGGGTVAYERRMYEPEDGPPWRTPVVVRDVAPGTDRLLGLPPDPDGNGSALHPSLSEHGREVVYDSTTPGLTPDDPDGAGTDVFLTSLAPGGGTRLVAADAELPDISGNAAYVIFRTRDALVPSDTNGTYDFYRKDLATGAVDLVSVG
ncbi:WD40 repeat protein [Motilibacter rhizosphaerae]|uniref:WD40 repeat protein n=1 Tax=Motilibacter rhizosphaerae TaxID=598652 RepID=A0A4Q7NPY8_9ACTN|nr:PD40 domain-containing protein [Motilibacter rhizosphaerae]RZS87361.1 WD40 repeat protein [Motilibacter rhizosphaerae]